ncbi:glycine oxidase [Paenibacillus cellulosilyticus]|uniref:glycine oxidase n=1 Tax=Paenibacillus cellulosilyticus TaxID=375489 RepID=A0A2V2YZT2_9BACL|nr:glycine oxidase ThiO [Paenibacillus cellulosilyticus]PWW07362.1 glycine oxidase [Paenibacillus cellulosilyticus]QKS44464.1 glycine oxidase ThiO [Paenibacillus cellulosilyticus]
MGEHVLIVGGGIIGLSCAFEAARRGKQVTVVEPDRFGGQASGAAAGMLAPYSENTEQPDSFFDLCLYSFGKYDAWTKAVEACSGMDVELMRTGSLNIAYHEADVLPMQTRLLWQNKRGARAEFVDGAALRKLEPRLTERAIAGLYCPEESHVYAPKLVIALHEACRRLGVRLVDYAGPIAAVHSGTEAGVAVTTVSGERYEGDRLVISAGAWSCAYADVLGFSPEVHPIRGQICSFESAPAEVRHMVFTSQAYWVGKGNGTIVCGASEDVAGFDTTVTERGIERLIRATDRSFPFLAGKPTVKRWAGLRPATRDGRPLIGIPSGRPDIVVAAGHYRNGILLSPGTAFIVADLLDGAEPELDVHDCRPERFGSTAAANRPNAQERVALEV